MRRFSRVLIVSPDFRFLAVEQKYRNSYLWNFPGGKVEKRERPWHAAQREVLEEIGIRCELRDLKFLTRKKILLEQKEWLGFYYLYVRCPVFAEIRENNKFRNLSFLSFPEMKSKRAFQETFHKIVLNNMEKIRKEIVCFDQGPLWINFSNASPSSVTAKA